MYGIVRDVGLAQITPAGGVTIFTNGDLNTTAGLLPELSGGAWANANGVLFFYKNGGSGADDLTVIDTSVAPFSVSDLGLVPSSGSFDATSCIPPVLTKAVSNNTAAPGDTRTYTFIIINPSGAPLSVDFDDVLPADLSFVLGTLSPNPPGGGTVNTFSTTTLNISGITVPTGLPPANQLSFTVDVLVSATCGGWRNIE